MTAIVDNGFARISKETIIRNPSNPGALTGDNIAYNSLLTINEKISTIPGGDVDVTASVVVNVPSGNLGATNVQDALNELQTEIDGFVGGSGDVVGPASSTDNALARFDATTGKLLQNGTVLESDIGTLSDVNSIKLNTSPTVTPVEGEIYWDSTVKNLMVRTGYDSVTTDVGREMHKLCRNNTGSTIVSGKVVYINGVSTNPTIALAQANDYTKTAKTLGVTTMDIANGTDGLVTIMGQVHDINTSGFAAGDILYLDSSTSGGIVNVNPTGINHTRIIGRCDISHATAGIISVEVGPLSSHPSDEFKVTDATDMTKQMTFNVSGITPGTKRTYTVPNQDVSLVGDISTQTLTNKSISLGTNTLTTTLAQLNTAVTDANLARTDAGNTFSGTQVLSGTGKLLTIGDDAAFYDLNEANACRLAGEQDATQAKLYLGTGGAAIQGTSTGGLTTTGTLTTSGNIELGNASDTTLSRVSAGRIAVEGVNVPTISSTDTLTNKTMTGATNTLTASVLKSATTEINVSSATAPSSGQVLTATSSTTATWQTPSSGTFKGCRVKQSSAQSIGTTLVPVAFDAETFDTDTMHDNVTNNSRITFTTAGYYQISGALNTDANAAAQVGIRLNGSTYIFLTSVGNAAANLANGPTVSIIYQFSASDYIEMMGYFGSTQNTKTGENGTHLSVAKVG